VEGELGLFVGSDGTIHAAGRVVRALVCPIGIDPGPFERVLDSAAARERFDKVRSSADGRAMIMGVDRLDYSKGLSERFGGYERFLASHPECHEKVFLLQIAPPSRTDVGSYQEIRSTLEGMAGRINGAYATAEWVPIRYVNQGYGREALAAMYRAARIGLVTPLRDGMNLVAKEYVAAQDPQDPGVLILSRFAGAAEQLTDALLVNPHSAEDIADAIATALAMPLDERRARWAKMREGVAAQDVGWWLRRFLAALDGEGVTLQPDLAALLR
jgi:trehalose 6-phosphate synthase